MNKNECTICYNYNNKLKNCNTCINSICNICISKLDIELVTDEIDENIQLQFKCPFCKSANSLDENHKDYNNIYKEKTKDLIFDLLEMKRSFFYIKNQLKQYETMIENKYYDTNVLLTT